MYDKTRPSVNLWGGQCEEGVKDEPQTGVAGTVGQGEVRNFGRVLLKQAPLLYKNSIDAVCLADTLATLGFAVDATHVKTDDSKSGEN